MSNTEQKAPAEVLNEVGQAWQALWSRASELSEEELSHPGVAGEWSGKDVLVHVGRWIEAAVTEIQRHLDGLPAAEDYSDYLAWNDRWAAEDQSLAPGAARARCAAAYAALLRILRALPAERWDTGVREWVENTTSGHFQEHAEQLAAWRAANPAEAATA